MNAVIRCDASSDIGTGHVMRCLALADMLVEQEASVSFVCRAFSGHMAERIRQRGYDAYLLPYDGASEISDCARTEYAHWLGVTQNTDAEQTRSVLSKLPQTDWIIVDHYGIDREWEQSMRGLVTGIMVIDCLANRPHDCDLLLDQNLYTTTENRHRAYVSEQCRVLMGPQFALLRSEFRQARAGLRERDGTVRRLLILFGGVDRTDETAKALESVVALGRPDIAVDVVVGASNANRLRLERRCAELPQVNFHCQSDRVAELMAAADLAIGAGGTTTWERCCLGLPSIMLIAAENQRQQAEALKAAGAAWNMGWHTEVSSQMIASTIGKALANPDLVREMSRRAYRLMQHDDTDGLDLLLNLLMEPKWEDV